MYTKHVLNRLCDLKVTDNSLIPLLITFPILAWWQLSSPKQYSNSNIKAIIYVTKKLLIDNMLPSYRREIHSSAICRYYWPSAHHCGSLMKQSYQKMQWRRGPFLGSHQCTSFWHGWKSIRSNISAPYCRAKKSTGMADKSFISTNIFSIHLCLCLLLFVSLYPSYLPSSNKII